MTNSSRLNHHALKNSKATNTTFELYLQKGFSDLEMASVTETLRCANSVLDAEYFTWRFVSEHAGLVQGSGGSLARTEPDVPDHGFSRCMIVPGNTAGRPEPWLRRLRSMRREGRCVVLLSNSAAEYVKRAKILNGPVCAHWRDIECLKELGHFPNLTTRLSEKTEGVITSAGAASTTELVIGLLAEFLALEDITEIGNRLLLQRLRRSNAEQPRFINESDLILDSKIQCVVRLMEEAIEEPLPISVLMERAGVCTRHMERKFRKFFNTTPSRFYKRLRIRKARLLIDETQMNVSEIAIATGFSSNSTFSKAFRKEYGTTPHALRLEMQKKLLEYQHSTEADLMLPAPTGGH